MAENTGCSLWTEYYWGVSFVGFFFFWLFFLLNNRWDHLNARFKWLLHSQSTVQQLTHFEIENGVRTYVRAVYIWSDSIDCKSVKFICISD